jgi:hypothetical protein
MIWKSSTPVLYLLLALGLWFPPGKGAPKWHQDTAKLFLGIDHTAIVVSNTETSLRCYRDLLGLQIVGESEN